MTHQLRLSRPRGRRPRVDRLTARQHALVQWARHRGSSFRLSDVARLRYVREVSTPGCVQTTLGGLEADGESAVFEAVTLETESYSDPGAAVRRLVARGLLVRVARGRYAARAIQERRVEGA